MKNLKKYSLKGQRGITDLECEYAWVGNSQGDESVTNDCTIGLHSGGWMSYVFHGIDPTNQEAINEESLKRKQRNQAYIDLLKAEGKYGQEYENNIYLIPNPIFDNPSVKASTTGLVSSRMFLIDGQQGKESENPQAE